MVEIEESMKAKFPLNRYIARILAPNFHWVGFIDARNFRDAKERLINLYSEESPPIINEHIKLWNICEVDMDGAYTIYSRNYIRHD